MKKASLMGIPFVGVARAGDPIGLGAAQSVGLPTTPLPQRLVFIINTVLALTAIVALGFIVYAGFKYITAQGDENTIEEAKRMIAGAVIGIVVIGLAAAIINFVVYAVFCAGIIIPGFGC